MDHFLDSLLGKWVTVYFGQATIYGKLQEGTSDFPYKVKGFAFSADSVKLVLAKPKNSGVLIELYC